jgi:uncharacterized protein
VGKTTTMLRQIEPEGGYSYTSLADPSTLALASQDVTTWLKNLRRPAVIDEAQLLSALPLALKELVDGLGPGNHFVLTGSASIGQTGLGGADPLARRSHRMTMSPLTAWEINDQPGSIIDALFSGRPIPGQVTELTDDQLLDDLTIGGFPGYVYSQPSQTRRQIQERIRSDFSAVLTQAALQGSSLDASIGRAVLDGLLRSPGGIFNASRLAQAHDIDRRTIDRYLGVFARLFLVHWLPNLATSPNRQSAARSKIHPVDVSFSAESLERAGVDLRSNREKFGELLESYVVNQLLAACEWAAISCDAYYWRQATNNSPEVDLVLVSSHGGSIGVEVKAASSVDPRDFSGLRKLKEARGLHRGYLFYTGAEVREYPDDMWALPIRALYESSTFEDKASAPVRENEVVTTTGTRRTPSSYDASIFLSYVHADDQTSGGRIVAFARDLVDTYSFLFGHELELFIDRDDILWGENWARRLTTEVEATSFLLSVVTPRYLKSEACRSEVLTFAAAAKKANYPKLLIPLQWVDVSHTDIVPAADPVRVLLAQNQHVDVSEMRRIDPGTVGYTELLEKVAIALHRTVVARASSTVVQPATNGDDELPDLMTVMEQLQDRKDELDVATNDFKEAFAAIGSVFTARKDVRPAGTYASANALSQLGRELTHPVKMLEAATSRVGEIWQEYDSGVSRLAQFLSESPDSDARRDMSDSLDALARSLELPGSAAMEQQLTMMGNFSRHLQPMSRVLTGALHLLKGIQQSARSWRDRL